MPEPLLLIADDEPNIRDTLAFILEMEGYRVALAADGEETLARVRELRPGIVLLDAMMPLRDGFEVCREIKSDPELRATTVIMVTALSQRGDHERARETGADHYLVKPFDEEDLLSLLRRLTGRA